jgi:AcrR family transcriptional regulator
MPGEPKTGRGRASRERIVEQAAQLFTERGIAATSVDEVLAAAGAGKGQFYHYFRSRDELETAAVGHRCAQVVTGLTQTLGTVSSLPELEKALAGYVAGFEQAGLPGCPIGTLATEVADRNEDARVRAAAGFDAWERLLADALERGAARGCPTVGAGHRPAGRHRGRHGAQPGPQGRRVAAHRGGCGAGSGADAAELIRPAGATGQRGVAGRGSRVATPVQASEDPIAGNRAAWTMRGFLAELLRSVSS